MDIWIHEDMNISRLGAESRTVAALSVLWRGGGYCMAAGGAGVLLFGVLEQFSRESYGYNVTQGIVAVGQIIVGPVLIVSARSLLKGRPWGRLVLELASWVLSILWVVFLVIMYTRILRFGGSGAIGIVGAIISAVPALVVSGLLAFSIWGLRSAQVRAHVNSRHDRVGAAPSFEEELGQ